ncbi:MAG: hypothetical protein KatS3mg067_1304 [Thermosynechococcus sp.]|nr:MAG: hypothetical protein KatS3mg067_1304 [Thermosynechococcus sp.]
MSVRKGWPLGLTMPCLPTVIEMLGSIPIDGLPCTVGLLVIGRNQQYQLPKQRRYLSEGLLCPGAILILLRPVPA